MKAPLERIADALDRIADVMCAEHDAVREARELAAGEVSPYDCSHPREYRYDNNEGAILRRGCHLCGVDDITKVRRAG